MGCLRNKATPVLNVKRMMVVTKDEEVVVEKDGTVLKLFRCRSGYLSFDSKWRHVSPLVFDVVVSLFFS